MIGSVCTSATNQSLEERRMFKNRISHMALTAAAAVALSSSAFAQGTIVSQPISEQDRPAVNAHCMTLMSEISTTGGDANNAGRHTVESGTTSSGTSATTNGAAGGNTTASGATTGGSTSGTAGSTSGAMSGTGAAGNATADAPAGSAGASGTTSGNASGTSATKTDTSDRETPGAVGSATVGSNGGESLDLASITLEDCKALGISTQ